MGTWQWGKSYGGWISVRQRPDWVHAHPGRDHSFAALHEIEQISQSLTVVGIALHCGTRPECPHHHHHHHHHHHWLKFAVCSHFQMAERKVTTLAVDKGSGMCNAVFAQNVPRALPPLTVGRPKMPGSAVDINRKDSYVGDETQSNIVKYPGRRDVIAPTGSCEPCRFADNCWRPLCPYTHPGNGRSKK